MRCPRLQQSCASILRHLLSVIHFIHAFLMLQHCMWQRSSLCLGSTLCPPGGTTNLSGFWHLVVVAITSTSFPGSCLPYSSWNSSAGKCWSRSASQCVVTRPKFFNRQRYSISSLGQNATGPHMLDAWSIESCSEG